MEKLLLVSEVAEITHRSPSSVYNIAYRNDKYVHTCKENGRLYIYAQDVPFIDKYPRESKKARAEYQQRIDTQTNIQFAEDFKAERMKLNKAKVPANAKQPFKQTPKQQAQAQTIQLQDLGGGKYALPAGWKIENGTLVKAKGLPKDFIDYLENYQEECKLACNYADLQNAVSMLLELVLIRDLYNNGWQAQWAGKMAEIQPKPHIFFDVYHKPQKGTTDKPKYPKLFVFKNNKTRDAFYNNFKTDLQTIAKLLS